VDDRRGKHWNLGNQRIPGRWVGDGSGEGVAKCERRRGVMRGNAVDGFGSSRVKESSSGACLMSAKPFRARSRLPYSLPSFTAVESCYLIRGFPLHRVCVIRGFPLHRVCVIRGFPVAAWMDATDGTLTMRTTTMLSRSLCSRVCKSN
jgi:hypothetical protein